MRAAGIAQPCPSRPRGYGAGLGGEILLRQEAREWNGARPSGSYPRPRWQRRNEPECRCAVCSSFDRRPPFTPPHEYRRSCRSPFQSVDWAGSPRKGSGQTFPASQRFSALVRALQCTLPVRRPLPIQERYRHKYFGDEDSLRAKAAGQATRSGPLLRQCG